MCSQPQNTPLGVLVSCRSCDQCIAARKNTWVARAMAEKVTMGHAALLTLTYRDYLDGRTPDGARAFHYQHVQTFLGRLRTAYARQYQARNEVSYICAGERGSRKDRVHWHMVLFSAKPVLDLGEWTDYQGNTLPGPRVNQRRALDHWSMWDHGTVDVMTPDQGGMAYVLKYALKDQFNQVKSRGKSRARKAEVHGASMFRMSKQPPIGWRFLDQKLSEWREKGVVPVRPQIQVPEYSGFWYPTGQARERFLMGLHQINREHRLENGVDCAGWSTLLARVSENEKDWECLVYGEVEKTEIRDLEETFELDAEQLAQRCGRARPCRACVRAETPQGREAFAAWYADQAQAYVTDQDGRGTIDEWFADQGRPNPFCALRATGRVKEACSARPQGKFAGDSARQAQDVQTAARQCEGGEG